MTLLKAVQVVLWVLYVLCVVAVKIAFAIIILSVVALQVLASVTGLMGEFHPRLR